MQSITGSETAWVNRLVALCLFVVVVGSVFASVAAAEPAMGFRGADVSANTVAVGENITVSATVVNVGDTGGGYTFSFKHNNTELDATTVNEFASTRVRVPANDDRTVTENVSFDRTGTFRITVNDKLAGVVTVQPSRARVRSETDDQRRIDVRATGVSASEPTELDIVATNNTFGLERWSTATGQTSFQQELTEYSDRSAVPVALPPANKSTVGGVLTVETEDRFERATMRVSVARSALANASLQPEAVTVYQRNGSSWDRLATTVIEERADDVVYEATGTSDTTYLVGSIRSDLSLTNTSIRTVATGDGQRLVLDAVISNTGPITGDYVGELRVNGVAVNTSRVTVPAGGESSLSVSNVVTEEGKYRLRLNDSTVHEVILADDDTDEQPTDATGATPSASDATPEESKSTQTATATADGGSANSPVAGVMPATVLGINTLYLVGGLAIGLGAFVAILVALRRSDSESGSDSFEQF